MVLSASLQYAAAAVVLRRVPDRELAEKPIIVVARWPKAKIVDHYSEDDPLYDRFRNRTTEVVVERVIAGDVSPGRYTVHLSSDTILPSDWPPLYKGGQLDRKALLGRVLGLMISHTMPEIDDASKSNLWFLSTLARHGTTGPDTYLSLDTGRGIQPLQLERYFGVLRQKDRDEKIVTLLAAEDEEAVLRALEDISGGHHRWRDISEWKREVELEEEMEMEPARREFHQPLVQHTVAVRGLLERKQPTVRRMAVKAYVWLADKDSLATMRQLISDRDPKVRGIAQGVVRAGGIPNPHP